MVSKHVGNHTRTGHKTHAFVRFLNTVSRHRHSMSFLSRTRVDRNSQSDNRILSMRFVDSESDIVVVIENGFGRIEILIQDRALRRGQIHE